MSHLRVQTRIALVFGYRALYSAFGGQRFRQILADLVILISNRVSALGPRDPGHGHRATSVTDAIRPRAPLLPNKTCARPRGD
jgi:hypothetical protein